VDEKTSTSTTRFAARTISGASEQARPSSRPRLIAMVIAFTATYHRKPRFRGQETRTQPGQARGSGPDATGRQSRVLTKGSSLETRPGTDPGNCPRQPRERRPGRHPGRITVRVSVRISSYPTGQTSPTLSDSRLARQRESLPETPSEKPRQPPGRPGVCPPTAEWRVSSVERRISRQDGPWRTYKLVWPAGRQRSTGLQPLTPSA